MEIFRKHYIQAGPTLRPRETHNLFARALNWVKFQV